MMGIQHDQKELFSYRVDLDKRVRADNPLRAIREGFDFSWVRERVKPLYGYNGNVSVDPAIIMKMMFLLFWDNVKSERELMHIIRERMDYLWFLGYGLDDEIPDHSVLSKARERWGRKVFEELFVTTVKRCVEAGLVGGRKIHVDGSLIDADASLDSVIKGPQELIVALKRAFGVQEQKFDDGNLGEPYYEPKSRKRMSKTDPDAPLVSRKTGDFARPRYKQHRVVDDEHAVITAQETTPADVAENTRLEELIEAHERNSALETQTVVGDKQYGTVDNFRRLKQRGLKTHMDFKHQAPAKEGQGIFPTEAFKYEPRTDTYICPEGKTLYRRRYDPRRQATEYHTRKGVCEICPLRPQCTRSKTGRTLMRHLEQELIDEARRESLSEPARRDRLRRRILSEGSFGQAATNHHFKRSRWRRLWRQQIQDDLIAAVQNIKTLINHRRNDQREALALAKGLLIALEKTFRPLLDSITAFQKYLSRIKPSFPPFAH